MKAKRLILALAATTVLASCGKGKEIKQDEAQDVAKNIAKKVSESDFKHPEKLQLSISMEGLNDENKVEKSTIEMNYSKPDYFYSVIIKSGSDSMSAYNYWEKNENLLYAVADATVDGKRSYAYSTISVDASKIDSTFAQYTTSQQAGYNMDFSKIGQLAGVVAVAATTSSSFSIDLGELGGSVETHYYSFGEGNLVVEATSTTKVGDKSVKSTGAFYIENYLVTKVTSDDGEGSKLSMEFRYGRANTGKPNLKDASKAEA